MRVANKKIFVFAVLLSPLTGCGTSSAGMAFHPGVAEAPICQNLDEQESSGSSFAAGTGIPSDPFVICTAAQLNQIANVPEYLSASYQLGTDIDLAAFDGATPATTFTPIGAYDTTANSGTPFSGVFDGKHFTLRNLQLTAPSSTSAIALFAYTSGATIQNLNLVGANVSGFKVSALLVARAENTSFQTIQLQGTLAQASGSLFAGGLIGNSVNNGPAITIENITGNLTVSGGDTVGGLIGRLDATNGASVTINQATSAGTITTTSPSGNTFAGVVGYVFTNSAVLSITNASSTMNITMNGAFTGGFIGTQVAQNHSTVTIDHCAYQGRLETTAVGYSGLFVAGFIGISEEDASTVTIRHSHSSGTVIQDSALYGTGGFMGFGQATNGAVVTIDQCYSDAAVQSPSVSNLAGGFLGDMENASGTFTISNSYTTSVFQVTGGSATNVGGFAGLVDTGGTLTNCYSAADLTGVVGMTTAGSGFVAVNRGTVNNSYWNSDLVTSGVPATRQIVTADAVTAETTASLKSATTFSGWDFSSIWAITPGNYPTLVQ